MRRLLVTGLVVLVLGSAVAIWRFGFPSTAMPVRGQPVQDFGAIHPRISPNGRQIVFSYHGSIWRMPFVGHEPGRAATMTRLTGDDGFDVEPVWSPEGKRIAYVNNLPHQSSRLRIIESDGGQPVPLPQPVQVLGTTFYHKLCFGLSGQRILGVFGLGGTDFGLAWFHLQSGKMTSVVRPPRWSRYAVSNAGQWIAFTGNTNVPGQQPGNDGPQADIWKVPADGGEPEKIIRFPSRIQDICWAPGDRALFVVSDLGGSHYDVWYLPIHDPDGRKRLTTGPADEDRPSVSKDGRWLLHTDNRNGCTSLVVRDLSSEHAHTLCVSEIDFRAPSGRLQLKTREKQTGNSVVARISLADESGKHYAPAGLLHHVFRDEGHFYCDGDCELILPAGKYLISARRGPEYRTSFDELHVPAGQVVQFDVLLDRWTDAAARGWYSGENHIHANYGYGEWYNTPASMLRQCAGEDLRVCNMMVANNDTSAVFDREFFRGRPDPLSTADTLLYWNQEFRSTVWGHMALLNLQRVVEPVFTGFKDTANPWDVPTNAEIADRTHRQNGLVNYSHAAVNPQDPFNTPWSAKGLPVDAALGKVDSMDLNYTYDASVPLWYRLLNCGFRIPASAGTDCFVNMISSQLPGEDRVYVKVAGPFSYQAWIDGLRAGRSFVTNGPMLEFSVNGAPVGKTVQLPAPGDVQVVAKAESQFPLERVEVVYNGRVVAEAALTNDRLQASVTDRHIPIDRSGWFSLRASGPGHPDHPTDRLDAHTSPIYVEVGGAPTSSRQDAEYFIRWIDRLSLTLRIRDRIPDSQQAQVRAQLEAARTVYTKLLRLAVQ